MSCSGAPRAGWPGSGWRPWAPAARCARTAGSPTSRGDEPLVTDYLWDEVLGRQPPEIRLFLLRTSVTEQMSGDLADALTGEPGGGRTLERLSRENSLVEALGNDHAGYRYHPLLRDVLAAERAPGDPARSPDPAAPRGALARSARPGHRRAAQRRRGGGLGLRGAHAGRGRDRRAGAQRGGELERVLALFPAEQRADDAAGGCRAGRGHGCGPATRTAPRQHLEAAQRALDRCSRRRAGASSPGWRRCG